LPSQRHVHPRLVTGAANQPDPNSSTGCYASNSDPNPVTDKRVRLEDEDYLFHKDGKLVTLHLAAPYGADNVDDWRMMAHDFAWR